MSPHVQGGDEDHFPAALEAAAAPVQAACWTPSLMLAHGATAHPSP